MLVPSRSVRVRLLGLGLGGIAILALGVAARAEDEPAHSAELDAAIIKQAKRNGVPEKLIRRIVMRESKYNARARNHSFWGLMQISYPTAKSMGFKGTPDQLLNPFVNLTYAVPYLANAFVIAGKREDAAVRLYASGYYATAKSRGLLGALRTAETAPVSGEMDTPVLALADATPQPPPQQTYGVFGALFGAGQEAQSVSPQPAQVQVATVAADGSAAPGATAALPAGKDDTDAVSMGVDKAGNPQPPKKWLHDGGISTIARGEQRIEQVAAYEHANGTEPEAKKPRASAKLRKTTTFAAIDPTPTSAQAYAGPSDAQDPRLAQSQAAIDQATAGAQAADQAGQPSAAPAPVAKQPALAGPKKSHVAHKTPAAKIAQTSDTSKRDGKTAKVAAGDTNAGLCGVGSGRPIGDARQLDRSRPLSPTSSSGGTGSRRRSPGIAG